MRDVSNAARNEFGKHSCRHEITDDGADWKNALVGSAWHQVVVCLRFFHYAEFEAICLLDCKAPDISRIPNWPALRADEESERFGGK